MSARAATYFGVHEARASTQAVWTAAWATSAWAWTAWAPAWAQAISARIELGAREKQTHHLFDSGGNLVGIGIVWKMQAGTSASRRMAWAALA